jgi:hypothetical protein
MRPGIIAAVVAMALAAVAAFVIWTILSGLGAKSADNDGPATGSISVCVPEPPEGNRDVAGLAALTGIVEIGAPRNVALSACVTDINKASRNADSDFLLTATRRGDIRRTSVRYSDEYTIQVNVRGEWLDLGPYANIIYDLGVMENTTHHLVYLMGCKDDHLNWLCPMASIYGDASKAFRFPKDHPNVEVDPSRAFNMGRYAIWIPVKEALHAGDAIRVYLDFMGRIILRGKSRATRKDYVYDVRQGRFKTAIGSPSIAK